MERHPADEPMEAPRRIAVAWVGGALDRKLGVVENLFEAYNERFKSVDSVDMEYFTHSQRKKLEEWIRQTPGRWSLPSPSTSGRGCCRFGR